MRPLEKLRVIDLSRVVSGPYCTMTLGDLGADIIKVERPGIGDDARGFAPPYQGDQSAYFLSVNRNKRSLTLDLKTEPGKDILWRLLETSDILVENFRPGVMQRLGFGYKAVRDRLPGLIYCSISGFGATGPESNRPGYDVVVQAEAGIMDITGPKDGAPHKVGTSISDLATGLTALNGILAALHVRNSTGKGQHVEISMFEATSALLTFNASIYFATGEAPRRRGNEHATIVPYEAFEASDGWLNLGIANDDLWQRFCQLIGRPSLANDSRFKMGPDRVSNRETLIPVIKDLMAERPRDDWLELLKQAGIPCAAIRSVAEVCESDILRERGMIAEMPHLTSGTVKAIKSPIHLSETPLDGYIAPPRLGEHTDDILRDVLGYDEPEIKKLRADGVI